MRGENFLIGALSWKYSQPNIFRTKSLRHRSIRSRAIREEIGRGWDCKVGKAWKLAGSGYFIAASINVTHPPAKEFERTSKQCRADGSSTRKYFFPTSNRKLLERVEPSYRPRIVFLFEVFLKRVVGKQEARILFANSTDFSSFNSFENSRLSKGMILIKSPIEPIVFGYF